MASIDTNFLIGASLGIILTFFIGMILYFLYGRSFIVKNVLTFVGFFIVINTFVVFGVFFIHERDIIDEVTLGIVLSMAAPLISWIYFLIFSNATDMVRGFQSIHRQSSFLAMKNLQPFSPNIGTKRFRELAQVSDSIAEFQKHFVETLEVANLILDEISGSVSTVNNYSQDIIEYFDDMNATRKSFDSIKDQASFSLTNIKQELASQRQSLENIMGTIENKVSNLNVIADQTKIVAINAAIEASQTEIEESGFLLVADDVTELSNRAGESLSQVTTEVRELYQTALTGMDDIDAMISSLMVVLKTFMENIQRMSLQVETRGVSITTLSSSLQNLQKSTENLSNLFADYKY